MSTTNTTSTAEVRVPTGRAREVFDIVRTKAQSAGSHIASFEADLEAMTKAIITAHKDALWKGAYGSWEECCAKEFEAIRRLRLPVEERRKLHKALGAGGLGVRPSAAATGLSPGTVQGDRVYKTGTAKPSPIFATGVLTTRVTNYMNELDERVVPGMPADERQRMREMFEAVRDKAVAGLKKLDMSTEDAALELTG